MNRIIFVLVLGLLFNTIPFAQTLNDFEKEADSLFKVWDNPGNPGVATGVIKDGKVVYLKGFGSADLDSKKPITPQTKFQLGEMSKQFTTLAILLLAEQGKINMNEDIHKYLPELPEYAHKVTIGHLLNHSSGLHDINRVNNMINGSTSILTQEEALKLIAAQKALAFIPGTDFSFHESVTESVLLAEIVSRSSNQSFADYVKINIFEPLDMKNSLIRDESNSILSDVALSYQKENGEGYKKHEVLSSVVGAINAYSSAEDLVKWYSNFTSPTGTLGRLVQKLDTPVQLSSGKKFEYYWGEMAIGREFSHLERGLPKLWNFGFQGGYGCNIFRFKEQDIISFVIGNNNQYNGSLAMNVVEPFLRDLYLLPAVIDYKTLKTKNLSKKKLKALEGHYWFKKAGYASKIYVENDTLRSQWMFSTRSQTLLPLSDDTFQQMGTNEDIRLFKFRKEGTNTALYFTYNDSEPDVMEKYEPVKPSVEALQAYAGIYYNEEYASLYSFRIEDGQLVARNLDHQDIKFKPVKKDEFTSTSLFFNALEFLRDESNRIKGFAIDTDGIHNLEFKKAPSN